MPGEQQEAGTVSAIPAFPPIVYIEPTNACNAYCVICPRRKMTRPVGMISAELFGRLVRQIAADGPAEVRLFHYGEPLLHPGLCSMLKACHALGLTARLQTNGLLLTPDMSLALLDAGLSYLGVSVNALTAPEYALIRPGRELDDVRERVRTFRRIAAHGGRGPHIHVNAQIVREDVSRRDGAIRSFVAYWAGIADSLSVSGLSLYGGIEYYSDGAMERCEQGRLTRKSPDAVACGEPFDRLVVKWDGRVTPCCADYDARWVIGDLRQDTLAALWRAPRMEELRRIVLERRYTDCELCRDCPKHYSDAFNMVFR